MDVMPSGLKTSFCQEVAVKLSSNPMDEDAERYVSKIAVSHFVPGGLLSGTDFMTLKYSSSVRSRRRSKSGRVFAHARRMG